jgi:tetratricopeptide (TPR) repeat protein
MLKSISIGALAVCLALWTGCRLDTGRMSTPPPPSHPEGVPGGTMDLNTTTEVDLVEKVAQHRQEYRQSLEMLMDYYTRTGNNRQLDWAKAELSAVKSMPQYSYIADTIPGPQLKATVVIPDADALYLQAQKLHGEGNALLVVKDRNAMRQAADLYKQLIRKYPTSDKIDDAAFALGTIDEYFKDYQSALTYYQRAYQWDNNTQHPTLFKAGYVLDKYMRRKAEALELYQQALKAEGVQFVEWRNWTEDRIRELTTGAEGSGKPQP